MPEPRRRRPQPRRTHVVRTERLTPHLVRVVLGGEGLREGFAPVHADSYVKVIFPAPGARYPDPLDLDAVREQFPPEQWPRLRSYTVRRWDADRAELTVDVVVHGEDGVAGPWAAAAQVGDVVHLQGPGGAWSPDPEAGSHLFLGDESALPAIAAALERLPTHAVVQALVEVHGPEDELPLARPVTWVHRGGQAVGEALLDATESLTVAPDVHAFVHGEATFVKILRRWLRVDLQVPADRVSISGYWRLGSDDEGWRAAKATWNAEAEALEVASGVA